MKTIFVIFFLFVIIGNAFADGNATNTELVFQVQNSTTNQIVKFRYSSVSETAILYETNSCAFSSVDDFSFTHNITGNNTTDNYFASIITDDSYPVELFEMVHALIKIDVIVNTVTKKTFYYDIRDCQYYTPCSGTTSGNDVTVRYDYGVNKLWFKKGVVTSSTDASASTGWEEISASSPTTKTFWAVFEYEHCIITAPEKPSGLVASYSGIHPRLDWNANTESNLKWYNIYKKDATENFTLFTNTTNTYYIDGYEYKGNKTDPKMYVKYKIRAVNTSNETSLPTDAVQILVADNNLEKKHVENTENILNYSLFQNYPNPFNPTTNVSYSVSKNGHVYLAVYNLLGEKVLILVNEHKLQGNYTVNFDGSNIPNGVYFYKLQSNNQMEIKKMLLLK